MIWASAPSYNLQIVQILVEAGLTIGLFIAGGIARNVYAKAKRIDSSFADVERKLDKIAENLAFITGQLQEHLRSHNGRSPRRDSQQT